MFRAWLNTSVWAPDGGDAGGAAAGTAAAAASTAAAPGVGAVTPGAVAAPGVFADTLPADLRELAMFKDIKDIDGLARGYANAQKMVGLDKARLVALPAEGDTSALNEFYTKLGRPDAPDKYGFKAPEGVTIDAKLQDAFAAKAHEAGLTTKQATALYEWWNGAAGQARTEMEAQSTQQRAAAETQLKALWGNAYDQNMELAVGAVAHYADAKALEELKGPLGNSPALTQLFAKLGMGLKEDGTLIGKAGGANSQTIAAPTEAKQQINALKADPAFLKSYTTKNDPGHGAAVARMAALYDQAYPTET